MLTVNKKYAVDFDTYNTIVLEKRKTTEKHKEGKGKEIWKQIAAFMRLVTSS